MHTLLSLFKLLKFTISNECLVFSTGEKTDGKSDRKRDRKIERKRETGREEIGYRQKDSQPEDTMDTEGETETHHE